MENTFILFNIKYWWLDQIYDKSIKSHMLLVSLFSFRFLFLSLFCAASILFPFSSFSFVFILHQWHTFRRMVYQTQDFREHQERRVLVLLLSPNKRIFFKFSFAIRCVVFVAPSERDGTIYNFWFNESRPHGRWIRKQEMNSIFKISPISSSIEFECGTFAFLLSLNITKRYFSKRDKVTESPKAKGSHKVYGKDSLSILFVCVSVSVCMMLFIFIRKLYK